MNTRTYHLERLIALCSLLFVAFFLVACSTGVSGASVTPTAASKPTPTPSPAVSSSEGKQTYTGMGFTVEYPSNLTVNASDNGSSGGGVMFSDPPAMITFYIEILPNTNESAPAEAVKGLTASLQKEGQSAKMIPLAPTVTVGGQTWDQAAGTTDLTLGGQTVTMEQVMIATNHPASSPNSRLFIFTYTTSAQMFDQTNATTFQPILQSFKFTS
jgi:hypothetical protein